MHKISRISLAFSGALLSVALLSACGDDNTPTSFGNYLSSQSSSIPQQPEQNSSSSIEQLPASSADIASSSSVTAPVEQSSSSETLLPPPLSSSSATTIPPDPNCVETPVATIALDSLSLADLADVFKSVRCNEKAVFVIRHGERDDGDHTKMSPLTYWENEKADTVAGQPTDGVRQAIAVGKKLISADEFTYTHTKYLRTEQTCFYINQGRGQATFPHDSSEIYSISWYKKDKERYNYYEEADPDRNIRNIISGWAYDNLYADAFYDLKERSEEIIKTQIAPDYASMNKFRVICSHDDFILPLSVFASNGTVNYRYHDPSSRHWPYYLTGVAVIIDDKNQIRYVPFRGLGIGAE